MKTGVKMKNQSLIILLIFFTLLQLSCSEDNPNVNEISPSSKKAWTIFLYDDADFPNAYDPLNDFSERVSSNEDINYLVLQDGNKTGAKYYRINEKNEPTILNDIEEVNMGSKTTLENFVNYAKKFFPAERYIVAFYDHGGAWKGACWDVTSGNDNLTVAEINNGLVNSGGTDIILFTAPCLMGSIEAAYQMRTSVEYYIGSEDRSGFIYWTGMWNAFDTFIKNNPTVSTENLAKEIIDLHDKNKNAFGYGSDITMSAIETSKLNALLGSFEKVTSYYKNHPEDFKSYTKDNLKMYGENYCDFLGMIKALYQNESDQNIKQTLNETISLFEACILAECHGASKTGSNGLNIYYPKQKYSSEVYYSPYGIGLDFKSDCSWGELIDKIIE